MTTVRVFEAMLEGAVAFEHTPAGICPARLPVDRAALFPSRDEALIGWARAPSGVRLHFATDSPRVALTADHVVPDGESARIDLTCDGVLLESRAVSGGETTATFEVPRGTTTQSAGALPVYEIWLDPAHRVSLSAVHIDDGATISVPVDHRLRWVTYGSSITMCRSATSPARTWPATAARLQNLHLTNLGFGGQCHLDPMVARVIRDLPAQIITLELGINVYGDASLTTRTFPAAVIGLLQVIRERHRTVPIGVITSIFSCDRETTANRVGCTLEDYRAMTREAVERVASCGDREVYLFEGLELFGADDAHMLPDDLHPNGEGYELIGKRAASSVLAPLHARIATGRPG